MRHPWLNKYPIPKDSKFLILGTHPPMPYGGRLDFYYGNMSEFWRFLDGVYPGQRLYNDGCPKLEDIIRFLAKLKMGISDLVEETDETPFSTDNDMRWTKLNSCLSKELENSQIKTIYFTSFSGQNSALSLFKKWLKENGLNDVKIPEAQQWRKNGFEISIFNRLIKLEILFSPSPTARRSGNRIPEFQNWKLTNPNGSFDQFRIDWYRSKLPKL